jgi:hypothetical protein
LLQLDEMRQTVDEKLQGTEKVMSKEITVGEWIAIRDAGRKIDPETAKVCCRYTLACTSPLPSAHHRDDTGERWNGRLEASEAYGPRQHGEHYQVRRYVTGAA